MADTVQTAGTYMWHDGQGIVPLPTPHRTSTEAVVTDWQPPTGDAVEIKYLGNTNLKWGARYRPISVSTVDPSTACSCASTTTINGLRDMLGMPVFRPHRASPCTKGEHQPHGRTADTK